MMTSSPVRRVPWTCKWGRFGGPVNARDEVAPGFVFWICGHPDADGPRLLGRDECDGCRRWTAPETQEPPSAA